MQTIAEFPPSPLPQTQAFMDACAQRTQVFTATAIEKKILREPTDPHPVPMLVITSRLRGLLRIILRQSLRTRAGSLRLRCLILKT